MKFELIRNSQGIPIYQLMDHNDKARNIYTSARVYRLKAIKTGKY